MTEEYKRKLYDCFLKDTPIKFESVTDEQFKQMQSSMSGAMIALQMAFAEFGETLSELVVTTSKAIRSMFRGKS